MPSTTVQVALPAPADRVWAWVADPGRLPRWWPDVDRVDRPEAATYVRWVKSPRGRAVPMRFELAELVPGERVTWAQTVAGTPFERSVKSSSEAIELQPEGDESVVSLTISRKLRGTAKLGSLFVRRGQKRQLESAASGLERAFA